MDCILPTVEFVLRILNRAGEPASLGLLNCDVYFAKKPTPSTTMPMITNEDYYLKSVQIFVDNITVGGSPKDAKVLVPLTIDLNNAIYEKLLTLETEDIVFKLKFTGVCFFGSGSVSSNIFYSSRPELPPPRPEFIVEASLGVEKWKRMISSYYKKLTWLPISRETYAELEKLVKEKGYLSFDELIKDLLKKK
jgi:hypothetical protein